MKDFAWNKGFGWDKKDIVSWDITNYGEDDLI